ncbi:MAG: DUF4070 domain-containing protein, partial [Bacteroidota bacterium]
RRPCTCRKKIRTLCKNHHSRRLQTDTRADYWRFMFWTTFRKPGLFADAVSFSIYGYHFRSIYGLKRNRFVRER